MGLWQKLTFGGGGGHVCRVFSPHWHPTIHHSTVKNADKNCHAVHPQGHQVTQQPHQLGLLDGSSIGTMPTASWVIANIFALLNAFCTQSPSSPLWDDSYLHRCVRLLSSSRHNCCWPKIWVTQERVSDTRWTTHRCHWHAANDGQTEMLVMCKKHPLNNSVHTQAKSPFTC